MRRGWTAKRSTRDPPDRGWPRKTRAERRAFNHNKRAYVEARYSKHYRITKELLDEATASIEKLQTVVKTACEERLEKC